MCCTRLVFLLSLAFVGLIGSYPLQEQPDAPESKVSATSTPECAMHNKKVLAVSDRNILDTVPKVDWQACGTFCTIWEVCDIWEFENEQCKTYRYKDSANQLCQLESTLDDVIGGLKGCTGEEK